MLNRACAEPGCLTYAVPGQSRCHTHRRAYDRPRWQRKNQRRNAAPGDGAARRLRALVNQTGGGNCQQCGELFHSRHLEVDHITPLIDNGQDNDDNLQVLCKPCHHLKTTTEAHMRNPGRSK